MKQNNKTKSSDDSSGDSSSCKSGSEAAATSPTKALVTAHTKAMATAPKKFLATTLVMVRQQCSSSRWQLMVRISGRTTSWVHFIQLQ